MLRQRLLAAVTVKAGRAVQSMGYKRYLPLGDVACVVENLDRWGADGIVVLSIDRQLEGPDLKLLKRLSQLKLSTPLTYGWDSSCSTGSCRGAIGSRETCDRSCTGRIE